MTQMQIMANNHNVMMFLTGMSIAKRNNSKLQLGACVVVFNYHQNLVCFQLLPVIQHLIYVDTDSYCWLRDCHNVQCGG